MTEGPTTEKAGNEGDQAAPTSRSVPVKRLPTPRIAFANQLNIVRAYGAASQGGTKSVDHKDVATMLNMAADTVSLANPFLSDVGLITRTESGYMPAPEAVAFASVYQWEQEKAPTELAPKLRETWFAETLLNRLVFAPMDEQSAITELAKVAQADKSYKTQLHTLLEYLDAAGLLALEGGMVKAVTTAVGATPKASPTVETPPAAAPTAGHIRGVATVGGSPGLPLLIQGLLQQLPPGDVWTAPEMETWLTLARNVFQVVYKIPSGETKAGP